MTADNKPTPKDSHYARLRRAHRRVGSIADRLPDDGGTVRLYGLHAVREAIANPRRRIHGLRITRNAARRIDLPDPSSLPFPVEICDPRMLDRLLGADAVHQGAMLEAEPLRPRALSALGDSRLVIVLDQVTDPHNVGAILRSAVAFGAEALITTARHSPRESGVLAKAASGALEHVDLIEVRNLADALVSLADAGYLTLGLDSEAPVPLGDVPRASRIALVLGAEGKGLREKTRHTVAALARLDLRGPIRSLNVSNAAAVALHITCAQLLGRPGG